MTSTLELVLCLDDGKTQKARQVLRNPLQNGMLIGRQLIRLLAQLTITCEVVSVEVTARNLAPPVMRQLDLFSYAASAAHRRDDLIVALTARFGTEPLYRVADLDPDYWLPELRFTLEPLEVA